jgi:hypothetical protein
LRDWMAFTAGVKATSLETTWVSVMRDLQKQAE